MALIDKILETCTILDLKREKVQLVTEPQKCDSPREILEKYARGLPLYGYNPTFQSDETDDEDRLLDSQFFEDEFDQREYVREYAQQDFKPSEASKKAVNEETEINSTVTSPKEETPV